MQRQKCKPKVRRSRWLRVNRAALAEQAGAVTSEYALLVGFIATVIVAIVGLIGQQLVPGFQAALVGL